MDYRSFPGIAIKEDNKKNITHRIVEATVEATGVAYHYIASRSRERDHVEARHIIHYLMSRHTKFPLASIGAITGRDHATVINSKKKVEEWTDEKFGVPAFREKLCNAERIVRVGLAPRIAMDIVKGREVKKVIHGSK
jgi:chromosomal replication initiation ATPase DnaA